MYTPVFPLHITQTMSMTDSYILVLDAPEKGVQVPILIGSNEAHAIFMAMENKQASRPLTHDLLNNILDQFMLEVKHVTIDRFDEGIFYASLYVSDGIFEKRIDSRTSDAIILALMRHCKIDMDVKVLEETSMQPGALRNNLPQYRDEKPTIEPTVEELEALLRRCEESEDYEQAAELQKRIDEMKNE